MRLQNNGGVMMTLRFPWMSILFGMLVFVSSAPAQSKDQLSRDEINAALAAKPDSGFV
jgi:hypothetical protein